MILNLYGCGFCAGVCARLVWAAPGMVGVSRLGVLVDHPASRQVAAAASGTLLGQRRLGGGSSTAASTTGTPPGHEVRTEGAAAEAAAEEAAADAAADAAGFGGVSYRPGLPASQTSVIVAEGISQPR